MEAVIKLPSANLCRPTLRYPWLVSWWRAQRPGTAGSQSQHLGPISSRNRRKLNRPLQKTAEVGILTEIIIFFGTSQGQLNQFFGNNSQVT
jgi:hypothetical protein